MIRNLVAKHTAGSLLPLKGLQNFIRHKFVFQVCGARQRRKRKHLARDMSVLLREQMCGLRQNWGL